MFNIDLHTHSTDSKDGGLSENDYIELLNSNRLDMIAITDHQSIKMALKLSTQSKFSGKIIVGQEIKSSRGEIIGLYLVEKISDNLSPSKTVKQIKKQGGLCIIPHPQDRFRSGLDLDTMNSILDNIDAIEVYNGRSIKTPDKRLSSWAEKHNITQISSSDAHSFAGAGHSYTVIDKLPTSPQDLADQLKKSSKLVYNRPPLSAYLAPKLNSLKHNLANLGKIK